MEKWSFKMLRLTFSSKLDRDCYIISIVKTFSKKTGALNCSMKFLSPEFALYLYKSTIRPCTEYCCHVWAGATNRYLELLDKLQKTDMQDFWSFTCYFSWALDLSSKCCRNLLVHPIDCTVFLSPSLDVTWMSISTVSFLAQLNSWNLCL